MAARPVPGVPLFRLVRTAYDIYCRATATAAACHRIRRTFEVSALARRRSPCREPICPLRQACGYDHQSGRSTFPIELVEHALDNLRQSGPGTEDP